MSMKKSKSIDLTSGPILKTLSELALPIMASSLLGTAYNITDMAWIGLLGSKAVAGVGVGGMYVWLSQGLVALPRMGGQVNTAQSCGRKDYKEARSYAASALQMTILFGLLFAAASIIFLDPLIGFFNLTDPEAYSSARSYMLITCGLIIFSFLNLTLTGLFTAQGDSRSPLMANFLGLVGNMLLDPLLILGIGPFPRLETAGAAIDHIFTFTRAVQTSGNCNLIIINSQLVIGIVQCNGNIGKALRLSKLCTGKDNVLHTGASQLLNTLFTKHPADCICNIALSTSVWAYDTGNTIMKFKKQFVGKGLKSLDLNAF